MYYSWKYVHYKELTASQVRYQESSNFIGGMATSGQKEVVSLPRLVQESFDASVQRKEGRREGRNNLLKY